jgi:hypothetical protein
MDSSPSLGCSHALNKPQSSCSLQTDPLDPRPADFTRRGAMLLYRLRVFAHPRPSSSRICPFTCTTILTLDFPFSFRSESIRTSSPSGVEVKERSNSRLQIQPTSPWDSGGPCTPCLMRNRRSSAGPYSPAVFHLHFHSPCLLLNRLYMCSLRGVRTCRTLRRILVVRYRSRLPG